MQQLFESAANEQRRFGVIEGEANWLDRLPTARGAFPSVFHTVVVRVFAKTNVSIYYWQIMMSLATTNCAQSPQ